MVAITDEIYEHILYDGKKHVSIGSLAGMRDRTITIGSFSKTYSVTGWRVGYALAGREITARLRKIHDFLTVGAPAPLQHACVAALSLPESYYRGLAEDYDRKRKILYNGLSEAGFSCQLPEGAYYIFTDIAESGMTDIAFARKLVETAGVAAVPGSSFYHEGGETKLRFTFSKKDETLDEACRRLKKADLWSGSKNQFTSQTASRHPAGRSQPPDTGNRQGHEDRVHHLLFCRPGGLCHRHVGMHGHRIAHGGFHGDVDQLFGLLVNTLRCHKRLDQAVEGRRHFRCFF